jgi:hypothetical protein
VLGAATAGEVTDSGLKQLKQRQKEQPERAQFDTEEVFSMVTDYFEPPEESEAFNIQIVERKSA